MVGGRDIAGRELFHGLLEQIGLEVAGFRDEVGDLVGAPALL